VAVFTVPPDFPLTVLARLTANGASPADRRDALATLAVILSSLSPQSYATRRTILELAELLDLDAGGITRAMKLLAAVGAVTLIQHHGLRQIAITPPGARRLGRPREFPVTIPVASAARPDIVAA